MWFSDLKVLVFVPLLKKWPVFCALRLRRRQWIQQAGQRVNKRNKMVRVGIVPRVGTMTRKRRKRQFDLGLDLQDCRIWSLYYIRAPASCHERMRGWRDEAFSEKYVEIQECVLSHGHYRFLHSRYQLWYELGRSSETSNGGLAWKDKSRSYSWWNANAWLSCT